MQSETPNIKELEGRHVVYVSYTGDFQGNQDIFNGLFGKVCGWAAPKGLLTSNAIMISAYKDDPKTTPPEKMSVDVCLVAPEDTEVDGEIMKKTLPGGKYAVAAFELEGPHEYGPAWEMMVEWAKENELELDMDRPSYEVYKNNPKDHPKCHHLLDICMSIR